jgi:hypothetical protein
MLRSRGCGVASRKFPVLFRSVAVYRSSPGYRHERSRLARGAGQSSSGSSKSDWIIERFAHRRLHATERSGSRDENHRCADLRGEVSIRKPGGCIEPSRDVSSTLTLTGD